MKLLDDMALFVEVAKMMSFRQAAEVTGVPNSTLSRRVSALEKAIGLRLFHRTTRKIELTEAGQLYYQRCRRIVDEAKLAHEQLGELVTHPTGTVRISAPIDFATIYIAPLLPEFSQHYPDIRLEFDLSSRRVDMTSELFDVAIRAGESENSSLIARKIAHFHHYVYASPNYLAQYGKPQTPNDLVNHQCFSIVKSAHWTLYNQDSCADIKVTNKLFVNSIGMIKQLAILNMGLILMPKEIVAQELEQGKLTHVLPDWKSAAVPIYAITETRLLPAKTRCFIDFLQQQLEMKIIKK
ncbi:LysR family transcriptional regulator [Photobacterium aquimaris]|uniref:HTH-type transcriptional regulator DmlR n=1 Tax=Photobacterium aquimaris TaxID=512643 RepID=A0A1Y6KT87_9GAMM|nr:LysR family transcriptional regulator [Photobacterium aquimaris]SMY15403.1 HTH-type transcriptional regulator DmlR [Photobacterium aquimaris]